MVNISACPQVGHVNNDSRQSSVMCLFYFVRSIPLSCVPGAMVLNTVPYFFTLSCSSASQCSFSSVSTMISQVMNSIFGGTSCRTPPTSTSTPRRENFSIGVTRSMPLMMQADKAASSNSAGMKASARPAKSVSNVMAADLHFAKLPWLSMRTVLTWKIDFCFELLMESLF